MDCHEVRDQLELFVLGGLDAAAASAVRMHLDVCAVCGEIERESRLVVSAVRDAGAEAPPRAGFARSLRRELAEEIASRRRRRRVRRAAVGAASLAAGILLAAGAWALWGAPDGGGRPTDSGNSAGVILERWRQDGASAQAASTADSVLVHRGSMYFLRPGAVGSEVAAADLDTGRRRWLSRAGSIGYIAADDRRVYCLAWPGGRRIELLALDAADGQPLWRRAEDRTDPLEAPCRPVPLADGRLAWVAQDTVHLIDAAGGQSVWRRTIEMSGPLSGVVAEGPHLFVAGGAWLYCLDLASGRVVWRQEVCPGPVARRRAELALADGTAYLAVPRRQGPAELLAMDLRTRQVRWRAEVGQVRHLLAGNGCLYLRADDVRAYDGATGRRLWTRPAGGCGPMTAQDGRLYVVDSRGSGRLLALDTLSGQQTWAIDGIRSCDAFRRVGQTGYVKTHDGVIHAIALRTP